MKSICAPGRSATPVRQSRRNGVRAEIGLTTALAQATPLLDQSTFNATCDAGFHASSPPSAVTEPHRVVNGHAESFTVGLDGLLDSVDVVLGKDPDNLAAILRILDTVGGVPIGGFAGSAVLASAVAPALIGEAASSLGPQPIWDIFRFDLRAAGLHVHVGELLAAEVILPDENLWAAGPAPLIPTGLSFGWSAVDGTGDLFWNHASTLDPTQGPFDSAFRTYVDAAATVPEPGSAVLMVLGLAGLVARRRAGAGVSV